MIYSHTVRPDDADTGSPGFYQHLLFQFDRILPTGFSKAGGEEMDAFNAFNRAVIEQIQYLGGRDGRNDKIDIAGDVTHRRITFESQDFLIFGMNRIYFSFKSQFHQGKDKTAAVTGFRGARDSDRFRVQYRFQWIW